MVIKVLFVAYPTEKQIGTLTFVGKGSNETSYQFISWESGNPKVINVQTFVKLFESIRYTL
jgi:hypothetical protein